MEERPPLSSLNLTKDPSGWILLTHRILRLMFHDSTPKEDVIAAIKQAIEQMKDEEWFILLPEGNETDYDQGSNNTQ